MYTFVVSSPATNGADNERFFATRSPGPLPSAWPTRRDHPALLHGAVQARGDQRPALDCDDHGELHVNGTSGPGVASSQSMLSIWLVPGATATLSAVVNPLQFTIQPDFVQWTDSGQCLNIGVPACDNESTLGVTVNAPDTETANYIVPMALEIVPPAESAFAGESVQTTVWVFGGIGTGTVFINPARLPAGVTVSFFICSPVCGAPSPNTMDFQTSTDPPTGRDPDASDCRGHATIHGAFLIPVNVTYSGAAGQPGGACGTVGQPGCLIYTLDIITPQAKVLGVSNAYGITTPGQTVLVYSSLRLAQPDTGSRSTWPVATRLQL